MNSLPPISLQKPVPFCLVFSVGAEADIWHHPVILTRRRGLASTLHTVPTSKRSCKILANDANNGKRGGNIFSRCKCVDSIYIEQYLIFIISDKIILHHWNVNAVHSIWAPQHNARSIVVVFASRLFRMFRQFKVNNELEIAELKVTSWLDWMKAFRMTYSTECSVQLNTSLCMLYNYQICSSSVPPLLTPPPHSDR